MKRVILKINTSGEIEVFTSLKTLTDKYPELLKVKDSIIYYLTRKKTDYITKDFTLRRVLVNDSTYEARIWAI